MFLVLLLLLPGMRSQEATSSRSLFNSVQFVQHKNAKNGPILFPNDAPPPPPTPLIVTSRPLSESIAKSELNPNNSLTAQSQFHQVTFKPEFLARNKNYKPFAYTVATVTPVYDYGVSKLGYGNPGAGGKRRENYYNDYEDYEQNPNARKSMLDNEDKSKHIVYHSSPYRREAYYYDDSDNHVHRGVKHDLDAVTDNDKDNMQRVVQPLYEVTGSGHQDHQDRYSPPQADNKYKHYNSKPNYQHRPESQDHYYPTNEGEHDNSKDYNHGDNYAFSYTVKDHKTGDDFSHSQQSTGSATNGQYRVRLPDGRMQIVSYTADENGYKADVRYDDQHNQDNSIDVDISKENQYNTNHVPNTYKHNNAPYNDPAVDPDSFENDEFVRQHIHNNNKGIHVPGLSKPTAYSNTLNDIYGNHDKNFDTINDYPSKNDYQPYSNYKTKTAYVDTTKVNIHDHGSGGLTDNNNEYLEHYNDKLIESNDKVHRTKDEDYFKFSDEIPSKEFMDYSSELNDPYQPHKSKFSAFANNQDAKTKLVPSYDELKDLFVTNPNSRRNSPVVVTTARPIYDVTPVDVVEITPRKPNLYTNIKNLVTPTPYVFPTVSPTTPRSYLLSTIANLKHQINLTSKPVLTQEYINKINKYLSYK